MARGRKPRQPQVLVDPPPIPWVPDRGHELEDSIPVSVANTDQRRRAREIDRSRYEAELIYTSQACDELAARHKKRLVAVRPHSPVAFTQVLCANYLHVFEQLKPAERLLLAGLLPLVEMGSNAIVVPDSEENGYGRPATIVDLAQLLRYSNQSRLSRRLRSLAALRILAVSSTGAQDHTRRVYFLNPEIAYRGDRSHIPETLQQMFGGRRAIPNLPDPILVRDSPTRRRRSPKSKISPVAKRAS